MSRITQLAEMKALRDDVEFLKKQAEELFARDRARTEALVQQQQRIQELEAKRGPGRPKKDE